MSPHHIQPPAVYVPPPPEPKETRRKRGVRGTGAASEVEEAGESAEPAPVSNAQIPAHSRPVEAVERRIPSTTGHLSDDTLKMLLEAQEKRER